MSYGHFKRTDSQSFPQYQLDVLPQDMNINHVERPSLFLHLSDSELSSTLMSYFPEGLPVVLLNENPCEYRRDNGSKFWILDSKSMNSTQLTMLMHVYKSTSVELFPTRYVLPNNTQYVRNIIQEVSDPPFVFHAGDFAVNVKIVAQSEDWLLQGRGEQQQLPATPTPKKTTTRRTTKKVATNQLEMG
jgi:hypothetical protein